MRCGEYKSSHKTQHTNNNYSSGKVKYIDPHHAESPQLSILMKAMSVD